MFSFFTKGKPSLCSSSLHLPWTVHPSLSVIAQASPVTDRVAQVALLISAKFKTSTFYFENKAMESIALRFSGGILYLYDMFIFNFKERPRSAVEQLCLAESTRPRMTVEEQMERIRRHQQACLREKKKGFSVLGASDQSPLQSPSSLRDNPFRVTQV